MIVMRRDFCWQHFKSFKLAVPCFILNSTFSISTDNQLPSIIGLSNSGAGVHSMTPGCATLNATNVINTSPEGYRE